MNEKKRKGVILGGKTGLLGQAIAKVLQKRGWNVLALSRDDLDVFNSEDCKEFIDKHQPDVLFNTVAYTMVDKAEEEKEKAYLLNKSLPVILGTACKDTGARFVHYSTDFVFDGKSGTAYSTEDEPNPQSVYGLSKLAGERALLDLNLKSLCIIRSAWLFGPYKANFVTKILNLAKNRDSLSVVHDQMGSPTYTMDLAGYSIDLLEREETGLFHVVNSGQASWCELAAEAVSVKGLPCKVQAIPSRDFPQKAARPAYSVLDTAKFEEKTGITPRSWIKALRDYLFQLDFTKESA